MAITVLGSFFNGMVVGDGVSTSLTFDASKQINADIFVPTGATPVAVNILFNSSATATISGTMLTLTWSTPLAAGAVENPGIQLAFIT